MKKWAYLLSGIVIGAVVATTGSVFADQIKSMVGQTVAGEYSVKVNGNSLTENAIVVDGKAHVPLRAVSDSLGANLKVEGKTINIDTQSESSPEVKKTASQTNVGSKIEGVPQQNDKSKEYIDSVKNYKSYWEKTLSDAEESRVKLNKQLDELSNLPASKDPITQETRKKSLVRTQGLIEEKNKEIDEYKSKIAEIEAQLDSLNK
ncbi:2,' 3'-cyclic nucleotide 2'-phosphodiesterase [Paenibacillus sp. Lou8.1]|uniref:2,' 3'-cyclic nucleotide 2'-phosphodiesterase n=1 Tax=Paenibacillus sp. Lou8.1 TaxID=2962041 RepID=UPI0020B6EC8D|nr:2,' 3'-cyclic nucleotide 2'-phosphodiesterase [Paenibacillus sp. Lou8.1]MCP3810074.1 2,' 3'-cyclic nucleotide 2'-phosphodiesterase [Paenibacillus sp. Lou8.1]